MAPTEDEEENIILTNCLSFQSCRTGVFTEQPFLFFALNSKYKMF